MTAVSISRVAFGCAFGPIPYQHGPEIFARNTLSSNDGYVLWHRKGSTYVWDYMVYLQWEGHEVTCDVSKGDQTLHSWTAFQGLPGRPAMSVFR